MIEDNYTIREEKKSDDDLLLIDEYAEYTTTNNNTPKMFPIAATPTTIASSFDRRISAQCPSGVNGDHTIVMDNNTKAIDKKIQNIVQKENNNNNRRVAGHILRTILMDVPLLLVLLTYGCVVWFRHVHDMYLVPQYQALPFHKERSIRDLTYYNRECSIHDMSTENGADLFLSINATPEEAYHHQLKHGFTVFPKILKPETSENLRNYIVGRNRKITEEESIYVIEGKNRFSFGLGTEEVSVRKALMEIGNSPRLRPALEAVLGPDPALIELTAITAAYGAVAQWWHDDVVSRGSPVQYGRAFGPSYSVFIQLQNTTKEMGATGCCPGTHYCADGNMEEFCQSNGFQLVNDDGHWGQGDALLMNMNSWHRGGAHTDPDGLDRVMLILTFVPKPIDRAETRQLSQGITFSLRWDMWGHTLNDLATADTAMTQPYATLRALGLYKRKSANWGIDYITSATIRAANDDNGFTTDDLDTVMGRGGLTFLPAFLQNFDIDWDRGDSWPEFIDGTTEKCLEFFGKLSKIAIAGYVAFFTVCAFLIHRKRSTFTLGATFIRISVLVSLPYLLFRLAKSHVDQTGWAKDISAGRRYVSTVDVDRKFVKGGLGPSTYPCTSDVLIEKRHGSEHLALYNDYITLGHPENAIFYGMVDDAAQYYGHYNEEFKDATVQHVSFGVFTNGGRFLQQGPDGYWMWLYDEDVFKFVRNELDIASNKYLGYVVKNVRYISSEYKYGKFRNTALSVRHAVPYIESLQTTLLSKSKENKTMVQSRAPKSINIMKINRLRLTLPNYRSRINNKRQVELQRFLEEYDEPYPGAWISQNDEVETFNNGLWYYGTVVFVNARGDYHVQYLDGSKHWIDKYSIRPFSPYRVGEKLLCFIDNSSEPCTILQMSRDELRYVVRLDDDDETKVPLQLGAFTRRGQQTRTAYRFKGPSYHN